jgi:hypothetical protein
LNGLNDLNVLNTMARGSLLGRSFGEYRLGFRRLQLGAADQLPAFRFNVQAEFSG